MYRLKTTLKIVITIFLFKLGDFKPKWTSEPLLYIDYSKFNYDFYFDRIVPLMLDIPNWRGNGVEKTVISLGVMITTDRILTSYNPYRLFIHNKTILSKIYAAPIISRIRKPSRGPGSDFFHNYLTYHIACGRQVFPDYKSDIRLCHGENGIDCPLHDLMVLRIQGNITFNKNPVFDYSAFPDNKETTLMTGIYRTEIALPNDTLSSYIKFASAAFINKYHIKNNRRLRKVEYDPEQNAVVDCDRWLPRDWGHFICVLNLGDYPALGSSAVLVSDKKVFGFGSFTLFRGKVGVFAFTDVRPYYDLIMNTCTYNDSQQKP